MDWKRVNIAFVQLEDGLGKALLHKECLPETAPASVALESRMSKMQMTHTPVSNSPKLHQCSRSTPSHQHMYTY